MNMISIKRFLFPVLLAVCFFTSSIQARPSLEDLRTGTLEEQKVAMYYFGASGNKKAFWYMVKNLDRVVGNDDKNPWNKSLRMAAAESLGVLADPRAVPFLLKRYLAESDPEIKRSIVFALRHFKDPGIKPVITDALNSSDADLKKEALLTAAFLGDESLGTTVQAVKNNSQADDIRYHAAFALVRLNQSRDEQIDFIRTGLKHKDPLIRFYSAYFIMKVEGLVAIDDLRMSLEIENYDWVKEQMYKALVFLKALKLRREEESVPSGYIHRDIYRP